MQKIDYDIKLKVGHFADLKIAFITFWHMVTFRTNVGHNSIIDNQ